MPAGWQRSELEMPITSEGVPHASIKTLGAPALCVRRWPRAPRWRPTRRSRETVGVLKIRGQVQELDDGIAAIVTIHPSFLLRIRDAADKRPEYRNFVSDLQQAQKMLGARGPS
jgi:hypothetical protein